MTVAAWIAVGLAAWAVAAVGLGIGIGRLVHAADHRAGLVEPGCCGHRGRHHMHWRTRVRVFLGRIPR